jgi:hypothetical protein
MRELEAKGSVCQPLLIRHRPSMTERAFIGIARAEPQSDESMARQVATLWAMPLESLRCLHCGAGNLSAFADHVLKCGNCGKLTEIVPNAASGAVPLCEIDDCGVAALGRCSICAKAFCVSHMSSNSKYECVVHELERRRQTIERGQRQVEQFRKDLAEQQAAANQRWGNANTGATFATAVGKVKNLEWGHGAQSSGVRFSRGSAPPQRTFGCWIMFVIRSERAYPSGGGDPEQEPVRVALVGERGDVLLAERRSTSDSRWTKLGQWQPSEALPTDLARAMRERVVKSPTQPTSTLQ